MQGKTARQMMAERSAQIQQTSHLQAPPMPGQRPMPQQTAQAYGPMGAGPMGQGPMPAPGMPGNQGMIRPAGGHHMAPGAPQGGPIPGSPVYNNANLPDYAWPTYAPNDNYAAVTYPSQYDASAFPYIGPFYPYPQVPMGWRSAQLDWDDGYWKLRFAPKTDKWWWFVNPANWH